MSAKMKLKINDRRLFSLPTSALKVFSFYYKYWKDHDCPKEFAPSFDEIKDEINIRYSTLITANEYLMLRGIIHMRKSGYDEDGNKKPPIIYWAKTVLS